ncbi:MAG: LemA family protein [Luteolibacter sp.]
MINQIEAEQAVSRGLAGIFGDGIFPWLLGIGALVLVAWAVGVYNRLVQGRNQFRNAFSQIDVQLKRRHDLIPNLVETAKRYMAHERDTLEAVIAARNQAEGARGAAALQPGDPAAMAGLASAEAGLGGVLGRLFAVAEAYPDLKANQNMMQLTEGLTSTENKIAFARQAYNDSVMSYNNLREMFPTNVIAGLFRFTEASFFEIENQTEREAVQVKF